MSSDSADPQQAAAIRSIIDTFLRERLEAKQATLKGADSEAHAQLSQSYQRETWLANAAQRVAQIQVVTHAVKFIHPDARGTSIHAPADPASARLVSSAGERLADDVVGNAAALDVFKLLKREYEGRTLLQLMQDGDINVVMALSDDAAQGHQWLQAFTAITDSRGSPTTHALAKQVYFPMEGGGYHLLAPLYPTSLVHGIYELLQTSRFSDATKVGRDARRNGRPHAGYADYPDLATRSFGGSKPQNISQANSERRGIGYLLPSFPPMWRSRGLQPPTRVDTIFGRWLTSFKALTETTRALQSFLSDTKHNNVAIRSARSRLVAQIVDEVLYRAMTVQQLPGGWSGDPQCKLNVTEALWLDPGRAELDETFADQRIKGDWPEVIAHRFGNWLNQQIRSDQLRVDDSSAAQWRADFAIEMSGFQQEVAHDR